MCLCNLYFFDHMSTLGQLLHSNTSGSIPLSLAASPVHCGCLWVFKKIRSCPRIVHSPLQIAAAPTEQWEEIVAAASDQGIQQVKRGSPSFTRSEERKWLTTWHETIAYLWRLPNQGVSTLIRPETKKRTGNAFPGPCPNPNPNPNPNP